jgi:hypothetical protein
MHLVDVEGALHDVALGAAAKPRGVFPGVSGDVPQFGGGAGAGLGIEAEGVCLPQQLARVGFDDIFIEFALGEPRHEAFPHVAFACA